jgi:hypothetical protein
LGNGFFCFIGFSGFFIHRFAGEFFQFPIHVSLSEAKRSGRNEGRKRRRISLRETVRRFKRYKSFPPDSEFRHPRHVPADADWYVMHIEGLPCIAGHMVKNVFYLVFLDKNHKFWPTMLHFT